MMILWFLIGVCAICQGVLNVPSGIWAMMGGMSGLTVAILIGSLFCVGYALWDAFRPIAAEMPPGLAEQQAEEIAAACWFDDEEVEA